MVVLFTITLILLGLGLMISLPFGTAAVFMMVADFSEEKVRKAFLICFVGALFLITATVLSLVGGMITIW